MWIASLFSLLLIVLGSVPTDESPPDSWAGDVPRAALAELPGTRSGEAHGTTYRFGVLSNADELARLRRAAMGSPFGGTEWIPDPERDELDWQNDRLVYVAFEGATRLLALDGVRTSGDGTVEMVFVARGSRRREGPEGPCSLLLWRADLPEGGRVRLIERAPDESEARLGELMLGTVDPG